MQAEQTHTATAVIVVNVPLRNVYDQWTQFEEFPKFMDGVEKVEQRGPDRVFFRVNVAGRTAEYEAKILEQVPDERIVWESIAGKKTGGRVQFERVSEGTKVTLDLNYEPEGALENAGDALGLVKNRAERDLKKFKEFIEARRTPTGAWRGEIPGPQVA
jgi:uncharacterized membrane protein